MSSILLLALVLTSSAEGYLISFIKNKPVQMAHSYWWEGTSFALHACQSSSKAAFFHPIPPHLPPQPRRKLSHPNLHPIYPTLWPFHLRDLKTLSAGLKKKPAGISICCWREKGRNPQLSWLNAVMECSICCWNTEWSLLLGTVKSGRGERGSDTWVRARGLKGEPGQHLKTSTPREGWLGCGKAELHSG